MPDPIPSHDDQGQRLLSDPEYQDLASQLIDNPDAFAALDPDLQNAYRATRRYHFQQSQADFSLEGWDIGGKSVEEVLALRQGHKQG
jgi:hypothetical protein